MMPKTATLMSQQNIDPRNPAKTFFLELFPMFQLSWSPLTREVLSYHFLCSVERKLWGHENRKGCVFMFSFLFMNETGDSTVVCLYVAPVIWSAGCYHHHVHHWILFESLNEVLRPLYLVPLWTCRTSLLLECTLQPLLSYVQAVTSDVIILHTSYYRPVKENFTCPFMNRPRAQTCSLEKSIYETWGAHEFLLTVGFMETSLFVHMVENACLKLKAGEQEISTL